MCDLFNNLWRHFCVDTQTDMRIADVAEGPQQMELFSGFRSARHNAAPFHRVEQLCRVEAASDGITVVKQAFSPPSAPEGMRSVIEHTGVVWSAILEKVSSAHTQHIALPGEFHYFDDNQNNFYKKSICYQQHIIKKAKLPFRR